MKAEPPKLTARIVPTWLNLHQRVVPSRHFKELNRLQPIVRFTWLTLERRRQLALNRFTFVCGAERHLPLMVRAVSSPLRRIDTLPLGGSEPKRRGGSLAVAV